MEGMSDIFGRTTFYTVDIYRRKVGHQKGPQLHVRDNSLKRREGRLHVKVHPCSWIRGTILDMLIF